MKRSLSRAAPYVHRVDNDADQGSRRSDPERQPLPPHDQSDILG